MGWDIEEPEKKNNNNKVFKILTVFIILLIVLICVIIGLLYYIKDIRNETQLINFDQRTFDFSFPIVQHNKSAND